MRQFTSLGLLAKHQRSRGGFRFFGALLCILRLVWVAPMAGVGGVAPFSMIGWNPLSLRQPGRLHEISRRLKGFRAVLLAGTKCRELELRVQSNSRPRMSFVGCMRGGRRRGLGPTVLAGWRWASGRTSSETATSTPSILARLGWLGGCWRCGSFREDST